ncbi:LINE-1 retrotransposable element ORF2 protein [Smittium culicis]|uniref:LINE-1 retrotransposable element ORF2 protein n=1 Tax=Smittium culicis TaxID=133412 RepID=A0A1R1XN61_9FUNG|nr:LINE-1 retrotransposable element ORF2 protein [Smittium culicis]
MIGPFTRIPGYQVFHDCAREGSNHGESLGISKSYVAQRIPGIEDFSGSSKSFFGNGDMTWSSIDHIIVNEAAKGLFSNARKWVTRLLSKSLHNKHKLSAVSDETGNLLTSPDKVMIRWSEFYTALSSDSTGNSRNPDRWREVLDNKKDSPLDINKDISWDEVRMVLMSLALHKAPGGDGLEVGWYKVLFNDYDVYCPESPMAKALLNLIQIIWRNGKIPKNRNITEIVPIPKKGDLQLLENYRGIALIPVRMKILGRIIISRITRQLEARKKISFLQAGFRRGMEAMAQVVSLYDILSRRRVAKKENFVPSSILSPMSPLFKVDKGVRQEIPMSPMLFNIFINDILDKVNENIALVPGNSVKIPGLLFADDLVLLADSEVGLRENILVVEKWESDNEMSFGISKRGALSVGGSFEHPDILELQGQSVPIVKGYWYLGVLINDEIDLLKFCRHKVEKAEACYANIKRLLSSKYASMASRVLFLRGILEARMRYGGEILGMYRDRSRSLKRVLNNGLKNLIGVSERATIIKMGNLWLEFEVPPLIGLMRSWGKVSSGWLNRMGLKDSFYIKYEFQKTNSYWKIGSKYPSYSVGLTWYAVWRCGVIWNSYLAHKLGRGNDEIKGKCPLCRCIMDHEFEIQSWHIFIDCTVLRASRRVSDLKTLSDNLYQRLDLNTESMGI